jgi:hypothetical protein
VALYKQNYKLAEYNEVKVSTGLVPPELLFLIYWRYYYGGTRYEVCLRHVNVIKKFRRCLYES